MIRSSQNSGICAFPTVDDTIDEEDETFTVTMSGVSSNAQLAADPTAKGTILDDDPPVLSFKQVSYTAAEGGSAVEVELMLTSALPGNLRVTITAEHGAGATAEDYTGISDGAGAIFIAGRTRSVFEVTAFDDAFDEADETVTFGFTIPSSADVTKGSVSEATLTLTDNDDPPTLSVGDVSGAEGTALTFTVTLSDESGKTVTVDYATSVETGDTATSGTDFTAKTSTTLTFEPGDPGDTTKTFTVQTTDDTDIEGDETFTVTLSNPSNATISDATAKGTIENDDEAALDVLVSNYPDGSGSDFSLNFVQSGNSQRHYFAQTFTAGAGFTLTAVDIPFKRVPDNSRVTVSLHARNGSKPGTYLADLDLSGALAVGDNTFAAPAGTALAAGSYFVRVRWRSGDTNNLLMTDGPDEETSAESGWSIEDRSQYSASGSSWSNWNQQFAMRVRGTIDGVPRVATGGVRIESDPDAHDSSGVGEEIEVAVGFTDDVTVDTTSGTPRVELTVGSNTRYADYSASDSSADELAFLYEVTADDHDQDGVSIDADALELNGGAIHKDGDTSTNAVLGHAALDADSDHRVNRDPFIVSDGVSVISDPQLAADTYGLGEVIEIEVEFSAAVDAATGTDFVLSVSGPKRAPLLRGSGTKKLVFGYTVVASDDDDSGIWIGEQDRTLVGNRQGDPQNGEITSAVTDRAADLDHDSPGVLSGHKVDGSRTTGNVVPSFTSDATISVAENETAVVTVAATDSDADDAVTGYAITGGADQTFFSIGATSGALTFDAAPNYEDAKDQGTDNTYVVDVTATSGTGTRVMTATQTITVTVTNVDEGQSGTVTIDDTTPMVGDELTASTTSAADPDGLPDPFAPTWKWYRTPDGGSETEITGETSATYTVVAAHLGATLTAKASWTDKGGFANTLSSAPTSAVAAAPSDDCTADTTTTCEVDVGGSATGNIHSETDVDWFRIDLVSDTRYQFDLEGDDTTRGNLGDPYLQLANSLGNVLGGTQNRDSGVGDNARVIWTPENIGNESVYLIVEGAASTTGTYTVSVIVLGANGASEADTDFPITTATTGRVEVGASATGNIATAGDVDWFKVVLEEGKFYQIDLEGSTGGGGTLGDPYLRNIRDSSGAEISETGNDDIDATLRNYDSRVIFNPTAAGAYYLVAGGAAMPNTGTYTLSVTEVETRTDEGDTDFASDITTLGLVEVGDSASGEIDPAGDVDWFRVVLEYDKTYVFDLEGTETSSGTLANPRLSVRNQTGVIQYSSDDDGGEGLNSRLEFTALYSGVHYLAASASLSATSGGTYTLSVREVTPSDDCSADTTTTCEVDVGGSAPGTFETGNDRDRFAVELEADTRYQIDVEGADTGRGTVENPSAVLFDSSSTNVGSNDDGGVGKNGRLIYTPTAAGTYYVQAGTISGAGNYTVSVIVLGANGNSEADTDFPDTTATTGRVEVGASATGNVAINFDGDRFRVDLEADKTYQFDLEGVPTGRGTLADPFLSVTDESNYLRDDDNSGTGLNSRITFTTTAAGSGTYYLTASHPDGSNTGTYTLSVRDVTPPDDLPANASTEGVVEVDGSAVRGDIYKPVHVERTGDDDVDGYDFDTDWFAVELKEGRTYQIDMKGAILDTPGLDADSEPVDPELTLSLPQINAIYGSNGGQLVNTFGRDESKSHHLFRVTFHAHDSGAYYIAASGESFEWGGYELTVIDITRDIGDYTNVGDDTNDKRGLKNLRAVEEKGGVRLTWQPPDGAAVTGYRIERRRAGGQDSGPQRSHGQPRDHHTLVEDTGNTETSYVDESAEQGVEYECRVTARNESGPGESSDWVRAGPEEEPVLGDGLPGAPRNLTATPGNREVTLSWDPPDDNGNPPATRYRIEWRVDGKDYDRNDWGTSQETTYTTNAQANLANGVKYFFRVKAENDDGNSYGPYGPSSEEVSSTPTSGSAVDLGTPVLSDTETLHHGIVKLDWQDIEDAGWYVVQYYHVEDEEWLDLPAEGVDIAFHGSSAVVSNLHGLSWLRVGAASCDGASEWSQIEELYGTNASDWEGVPVPEVEEGDEIEPCPVVLGTPALSDTEILHHGMVQLDWQDIEDAGWYVVQYYHLEDEEWLDLPAEGVDIAFHGSSAVVSNLHGLSWLRVGAASCDGASEWSQIEQLFGTNASDWKGVPVPEVAEGDEIEPCSEDADTPDNSPATGAPTISGTAQVGETLTANTSGIADADGLSNVQYEYQWLADDTDISGATNATYTLTDSEESKAITVQVSFTDDADNEETLTSAATEAVSAAPTPNSPATGAPTINGTAQVGETLTAHTSGVADADGLANATFNYQWLADDTDIAGATGLTYTLTDSEESKAIKVQVSFTDDADNEETLTSAATEAVAGAQPTEPPAKPRNLEATATHDSVTLTWDDPGDDTITGYVILRRIPGDDPEGHFDELVADTGTAAITYTDDTVSAGTRYTYRIKAINGAGTSERSRWFHIDVPAAPVPDQPTGLEATESDGQVVLTWDDPGDDSITGYVILRRVRENDSGGDFSVLVADTGTAALTYTDDTVATGLTYTYRIKAINEHGTSERSRWYHIDIPEAP